MGPMIPKEMKYKVQDSVNCSEFNAGFKTFQSNNKSTVQVTVQDLKKSVYDSVRGSGFGPEFKTFQSTIQSTVQD